MTSSINDILKYIVQLTFLVIILKEAYIFIKSAKSNLNFNINIWKKFSFEILFESILLVIPTVMFAYYLSKIPFLSFGWYKLFFGENRNAILSIVDTEGSNLISIIFSLVVLFILILLIPHLAKMEEIIFRKNKLILKDRIKSSIIFGLAHCLMGISIGVGIALILPGFYFSIIYKKTYEKNIENGLTEEESKEKALEYSTVFHTQYNTILIGTAFVLFLLMLYIKF